MSKCNQVYEIIKEVKKSESGNVLDYKVVKLSKEERTSLIQACKSHIGSEPEFIDASIDFLYDNDARTYEWLYNENIDY